MTNEWKKIVSAHSIGVIRLNADKFIGVIRLNADKNAEYAIYFRMIDVHKHLHL